MKVLSIFLTICFSLGAFAQQEEVNLNPIHFPDEVKIRKQDLTLISLPRIAFIDRIIMEIKISPLCGHGSFDVTFDSMSKKTLHLPGNVLGWRKKIINVSERARSIEIYNNLNCKLKIRNIQVLPRRYTFNNGGKPVYEANTDSAAHVNFILENLVFIESLVGDQDRIKYLTPTKKVLGNALSVINTSPETSQSARFAIEKVITQLNEIHPFIEKLQSIESTFDIAREILSAKQTLEKMIR